MKNVNLNKKSNYLIIVMNLILGLTHSQRAIIIITLRIHTKFQFLIIYSI